MDTKPTNNNHEAGNLVQLEQWKKPELKSLGKVSSHVLTWWWSCDHGDNDINTINPGCF